MTDADGGRGWKNADRKMRIEKCGKKDNSIIIIFWIHKFY